ncbi:hypothetical protein B8A39_03990 [Dolosigranulum pigrum]|uniref:Uncharacterized protein n=3 Tax=Dolosigranulum TaxID=29393 RepID=A0A1S8KQ09_9LACT|nr:PLP-dependent aminotransferase family protein [Dolosigranulum pigrum]OOL81809.1 hypothetical protein BWX42_08950 [Dolosigranulum pigrum]RAN52321.1 hypothetical protein B8A39_03990 [Dolosigranulum pigrum]
MFKYIEIAENVKSELTNFDRQLPSIRHLAKQYSSSKQTVVQALKLLESQHLIYSKPQSGYYVVNQRDNVKQKETIVYDFANSSPDWNLFPYDDFKHCMSQAMNRYHRDLFIYGTSKGLPQLVQTMKKQLENRQVFTSLDNLFITSGIQQALNILCQMTFPNEKETILLEEPTYSLFIDLIKLYNLPALSIKRSNNGIDLNCLEELFKTESIKFFYTIPRFNNPLGVSYSKNERQKIVELAQKYDVYIVEDDYLADFDINENVDPLFSYDMHEKVIYLKSFSKVLFPGLRIGTVVLPSMLKQTFAKYKKASDIDSAMFSQAALEIYINNGMYDYHLRKMREIYHEKTQLFCETVQKHTLSQKLNLSSPPLAMKTHLVMPKKLSIQSLIKVCKKKSIFLKSAQTNYYTLSKEERENLLLIELSNTQTEVIEEGTNLLLDEVQVKLRL